MASTIKWFGDNGGSDGNAANNRDLSGGGTKFRFRTDDDWHTIDGVNPVPIPGAGTNYAGWIHFYAKMTARPGTESVNNFKLYTDGAGYGTGIVVNVAGEFPTNNSGAAESGYEIAAFNPVGTTAYEMTVAAPNGHSILDTALDVFGYTSASPFSGPTISEAGAVLNAVSEMTNYFVLQAAVGTTASAGVKTAETFTLRYDEIV
jgi:hypothetical protein